MVAHAAERAERSVYELNPRAMDIPGIVVFAR